MSDDPTRRLRLNGVAYQVWQPPDTKYPVLCREVEYGKPAPRAAEFVSEKAAAEFVQWMDDLTQFAVAQGVPHE